MAEPVPEVQPPVRGLTAELDRFMATLRQGGFGIGGLLLILIALVAVFSLFEPTTFPRATTLQAMMFQLPELGLPVTAARALLGDGALIGASCHDAAGLARAAEQGASFATLSPV